ncbi:MAG: hypothetical protein JXB45_04030 [Candidatus Krumholzibacteriota bacterium]|nr:hypothetical protein [Candidatus Krumholzibacteriota bacterium]
MMKRVISAGLLGAVVLMAWTLIVNGVLRFQASIDMKQISAERQVYEVLKEHITDPGRYVCNPELTSDGRFPNEEPVFSVLYSGRGHESAGGLMFVGLAVFILAPMISAWMLSQMSERIKSSYARKLLFFVAIGLLFALFGDLMRFGIGSYPLKDVTAFAINHIVVWTLVGLVEAWRIQPQRSE